MGVQNLRRVLVIGCGISGLSAAIKCAEHGMHVILAAPTVSERTQSVMAAGGINAARIDAGSDDSVELHAQETLKSGCFIEDPAAVQVLCSRAPAALAWLDEMGVVFSREPDGSISRRAFGGQSRKRTAFSGAATGKQIITALVQRCRQLECEGRVERRHGRYFHSAIILEGCCHGALLYNEGAGEFEAVTADATVVATGGFNRLFGKTTGSTLDDGYATGRLFEQGVTLRNLEFVQYHPTTIETSHKRLLVSEAARGEGGRLYYEQGGHRVYFMEEKYGPNGNLMSRDIVSRCVYEAPSQVYLDLTFLDDRVIHGRLGEIVNLCHDYLDLDVTREPIPVAPSVHFFMGGIDVGPDHATNIAGLYAVGECASRYHGANRLGGNSLMSAVVSGHIAGENIAEAPSQAGSQIAVDVQNEATRLEKKALHAAEASRAVRGVCSISKCEQALALAVSRGLGVIRSEGQLRSSLSAIQRVRADVDQLEYDLGFLPYENYRLPAMALLAEACVRCALNRQETRGAHIRVDYPETDVHLARSTLATYKDGDIVVRFAENGEAGERIED